MARDLVASCCVLVLEVAEWPVFSVFDLILTAQQTILTYVSISTRIFNSAVAI